MKDAALSCLSDWLMLCLAKGLRMPEDDPAGFRKLSEEFCAKLRALSPSEIERLRQLPTAAAAWMEK